MLKEDDEGETQAESVSGSSRNSRPAMDINFVNYITSLGLQALIFLGISPSPITQQNEKNLDQARILIDTLVMLRDKTKGNLTEQENSLLEASIYELEIRFVEVTKDDQSQEKETW